MLCLLLGVARPGERPEDSELNLEGIDDKEIEMVSKTHIVQLMGIMNFIILYVLLTDVTFGGRGKDKGTALVQ